MKFFSTFSQKYLEVIKKAVSLQRFREIEHIKLNEQMKGRLAQLVQSICLTSRGSAVRIRQRPHKTDNTKVLSVFSLCTLLS